MVHIAPISNAYKRIVVLIGFHDIWFLLNQEIQKYDNNPHFTSAVLGALCDEALGNSDWTADTSVQDVIHELVNVGCDEEVAFELCRTASHLIYQKITQHIPDWGSAIYNSTAKYTMRSENVAQIEFATSVFC